MPSDRKARSQAFGAYTFLTADKKYSFARATQLGGKGALGLFAGVRFDGATGIAALLKIVAPMSPSATGGRSPDGGTPSLPNPAACHDALIHSAPPRIRWIPQSPPFRCDVQPHTLGTACFTVAPMSPSATGGRSPDGEDTVATKSRSLPRRVNSLSAAANPLDPAKPAFSVRRPAAHPRHRLLYCSADVPIGDWWQALDGGDTVATYLAAVPRGAVAAATGAAAEAF